MLSYDQPAAAIWVSYLSTQINAIFPFVQDTKVPVKTSNPCFSKYPELVYINFVRQEGKKNPKVSLSVLMQKHSLASALVNLRSKKKIQIYHCHHYAHCHAT